MSTEHENLHQLLGAFVLGGLDPDEHRAFTAHLRSCAECQREAAQLSGLPALLSLVPMDVAGTATTSTARSAVPSTPTSLTDRIRHDRRRRRVWAGALIAAVAAGFLVLGFAIRPAITGPQTSTVQAAQSINVTAEPDDPAHPVQAALQMFPKQWGTQLDLQASYLPTGGMMTLWIIGTDGASHQVASWNATDAGRCSLSAASSVRTSAIASIELRTEAGKKLATARLAG
ncbi:MAG: zf-HC2 domain-containing protein [Actinomycetota bacterium]|nr:zf-HC2 domain-containing protein [Actinomycetota bacterium]